MAKRERESGRLWVQATEESEQQRLVRAKVANWPMEATARESAAAAEAAAMSMSWPEPADQMVHWQSRQCLPSIQLLEHYL